MFAAHEMIFSTLPSGGTCVQPGFGAPPLGWDSRSEVLTTHLRAFGPVWLLQGHTRRLPPTEFVNVETWAVSTSSLDTGLRRHDVS